jgi:hypothetical protein
LVSWQAPRESGPNQQTAYRRNFGAPLQSKSDERIRINGISIRHPSRQDRAQSMNDGIDDSLTAMPRSIKTKA